MVRLAATAVGTGPVTLVGAIVENDRAFAMRVRLADRTGGPVHPPRRHGVPQAGWGEAGVAVDLEAGATRAVGYATPAEPVDPPVAVEAVERVPADDRDDAPTRLGTVLAATPTGVVRALGDPAPPRDAVPALQNREPATGRESAPSVDGPSTNAEPAAPTAAPEAANGVAARPEVPEATDSAQTAGTEATAASADPPVDAGDGRVAADGEPPSDGTESSACEPTDLESSKPPATGGGRGESPTAPSAPNASLARRDPEAWLREATRRIERAERLAAATDLETAAERIAAAGGLGDVRALVEAIERDAAALETLAQRADALADRAAAVEVPVETFERLA